MPARLGRAYLRSMYRYVVRSPWETVETVCDDNRLLGAAVTTLRPRSLVWRLIIHTSLTWHGSVLATDVLSALLKRRIVSDGSRTRRYRDAPELVWIFVRSEERGRAIGSRLIRDTEAKLRSRGFGSYSVRTVPLATDPARVFYDRHGFREQGTFLALGSEFQWLVKIL
jgi:GNAT superfamily N-acetyltransferase